MTGWFRLEADYDKIDQGQEPAATALRSIAVQTIDDKFDQTIAAIRQTVGRSAQSHSS